MTENKIGILGLARRAGKVILGFENIEKTPKKCVLLFAATDASERTKKNIEKLGLPVIDTEMTKSELGSVLGVGEVAVMALTDENFAKSFI